MILLQKFAICMLFVIGFSLVYVRCLIITDWKDKYDYIIVGGGTAGCVLANRLSENPDNSVLLLEAGQNPNDPFISVPYTWISVSNNPALDWGFFTEKQKYTGTKKKQSILQAKMLGGSSAHNAMLVTRGSSFDYDRWSELGNNGWSYDEVLPYFKKLETVINNELSSDFRGVSGPVKIKTAFKRPEVREIFKALSELGYDVVSDYNKPNVSGFGWGQYNVNERGIRMSTLEAYLKPVLGRHNLDVVVNAFVTKINLRNNIKRMRKKAFGVYFQHNGMSHYVRARKEVIVSAGSLNSPKILMLSGIGPKLHLKQMGIPIFMNLPVGKNLQDHGFVIIPVSIRESSPLPRMKIFTFESLFEYIFSGKGQWANPSNRIVNFYNSATQNSKDRFPYMEQLFDMPALILNTELEQSLRNGSGIISEFVKDLQSIDQGPRSINVFIAHLHPRNTGTVKLKSKDPEISPVVDYQFAANEKDMDDFVEGIRRVQKLINTTVLQDAGFILPIQCPVKECSSVTYDTDEYWKCCVKFKIGSLSHYSGTCKMATDKTGVVDEYLRVKDIDNLRVVDASIMPMIPSGHTNIPTIMVAEKAADLIKESQ